MAENKDGLVSKFGRLFFKNDWNAVKKHVVDDIVVPNTSDFMKRIAYTAVTEVANMVIYGKDAKGNPNSGKGLPVKSVDNKTSAKAGMRERIDYSNILIAPETTPDGRTVIRTAYEVMKDLIGIMEGRIREDDYVTVADLYSLLNKSGVSQVDVEYGWRKLKGWTYHVLPNDNVRLYLPRPVYLNI